ncbi:uncharacterized protein CTRU02_210247 [Colletotrichum truncatum]|uniref:Uncharacterized protein n=1 Tax=Colletotrichum truncatum TaxID=5467 RepID=A0ACC3YUN8_COLTU|nr:uncharacterized protein CTRU02_11457 [Colletotrichum truncatum]KAF6785832.1 hypothetical protein CTRU02_11457 [Colletotrichum truncatum]
MGRTTRSSARTQNVVTEKVSAKLPIPTESLEGPGSIPILLFENQAAWEAWLVDHHTQTSAVWLQISKKNAPTPTVSYDEALDVSLCYGWIDGQRKSHDEQHFIQRFTPRRKNSLWSKRNVDKVARLTELKRMRAPGQAEVDAAKVDGRWDRAYSSASLMEVPLDFQTALEENLSARKFFDALNRTQRYAFLWRIETTKRPETRKRKIAQFIDVLAEHKTL